MGTGSTPRLINELYSPIVPACRLQRTVMAFPALCSEGGFFKGVLTFPQDYPSNPPEFRFTSDMWHPNGTKAGCARSAALRPLLRFCMLHCSTFACCNKLHSNLRAGGHRAVYPDGRVCISILHAPGDDPMGYESASERWLPVHTVRSALATADATTCCLPSVYRQRCESAIWSTFSGSHVRCRSRMIESK